MLNIANNKTSPKIYTIITSVTLVLVLLALFLSQGERLHSVGSDSGNWGNESNNKICVCVSANTWYYSNLSA
ncbi:MAG: hypothetical protein AABY14_00705 [Nanoarchaeota archaeon]